MPQAGLGSRIWGSGFRVSGLVLRVAGLGDASVREKARERARRVFVMNRNLHDHHVFPPVKAL